MHKSLFRIITLFVISFSIICVNAQQLPVNIDALTDQQLIQFVNQAQLAGLSEIELETKARERGLSNDQILKLKQRLLSLNLLQGGAANNSNGDKQSTDPSSANSMGNLRNKVLIYGPAYKDSLSRALRVFGADLFDNENLSFEPNLNIPTPRNYILGVNDQLLIEVFGYSEASFKLKVSPEGTIRVPGLGLIRVLGLTMEDAQKKIRHELTKIYSNILTGKTSVQISLGQIRSIKVTIIGEIKKPGSYTLSSFATIANALYASGGPKDIGSFRKIELLRNGKLIASFDLYDFLLNGDLTKNLGLQDDDIIRVPAYEKRVIVKGAVKRPAIFELSKNENLDEALRYSGGFADIAFKEMIRVKRFASSNKEILSVRPVSFKSFPLLSGDSLIVDSLADVFSNRIMITGEVSYPGTYGSDNVKTLKDLLELSKPKESAYMERGVIRRLKADYSPISIDFSPTSVLTGATNFNLQREDSIHIYSRAGLLEKYILQIDGEVNKPGEYAFADSMKVLDLIMKAQGFKDGASESSIEVSRRNRTNQNDSTNYSIVKRIDISQSNQINNPDLYFTLEPFDIVFVRKSPHYKEQISVSIEGEVKFPGRYSVISKDEKLTDLIKRAGGLKSEAYTEGALLIRNTFQGRTPADTALFKNKLNILATQSNVNKDNEVKVNGQDTAKNSKFKESLADQQKPVGIRLPDALQDEKSIFNLLLEEGDVLKIPKRIQTVQSFGSVYVPQKIVYRDGLNLKDIVRESGGFTKDAIKKRSYIVYANGEVASSSKVLLFFNTYPKVKPGAEIFVPAKDSKKGLSTAEFIGIASGIASVAGIVIAILNATK